MNPNNLASTITAPEQVAEACGRHNPIVCHYYGREGHSIAFKCMEEVAREQDGGIHDVRMVFRAESAPDPRRYNAPTADEIGVLIIGCDDESDVEPKNRDIVLHLRGQENNDGLFRLSELNQHYDPFHYVLMFPKGDRGWNINIKSYDPDRMDIDDVPLNETSEEPAIIPVINEPAARQSEKAEVSVMQYYSSRLMLRPVNDLPANQQISIHSFGKLFHQYVVDMYAKMEQQRLNFIRFNRKALRAEVYSGLADAIRLDDNDMSSVGKCVILPSSFVGGPRFMAQLFQDAMNLVRRFGKPDLFITFTCNPAWPEIADELLVNQRPSDRLDNLESQ